jgi:uncharacterized membrane protein YgdD (TMEM256/DUF423 family)
MSSLFSRVSAGLAFLAIALGAFGAHALKPILERHEMSAVWNTAVLYHIVHAVALFALGAFARIPRGAAWLFVAGIALFSGSLYVIAITNIRSLGVITPVGGLCFLAGWAWLAIAPPAK